MNIKTYKPNDTARVEAMKVSLDTAEAAIQWAAGAVKAERVPHLDQLEVVLRVETLEGWVDLPWGHWLVRGTHGEFYPCDPDVFENRWVEVSE